MSFDDGRNLVYLVVHNFSNREELVLGVADGKEAGFITNCKGDSKNTIWVGHRPFFPVTRYAAHRSARVEASVKLVRVRWWVGRHCKGGGRGEGRGKVNATKEKAMNGSFSRLKRQ